MPGERRIKGWKLLPSAAADLDAIWDYTADTWSVDQAESYLSGIEHTLELLVAHPELGPEHQEINPPVRLHPHRSHLIIYRLEAEFVIVLRIGHMRQHWRALLRQEGTE